MLSLNGTIDSSKPLVRRTGNGMQIIVESWPLIDSSERKADGTQVSTYRITLSDKVLTGEGWLGPLFFYMRLLTV